MGNPMEINIAVDDKASPKIHALLAALQDMTEVHEHVANSAYVLVQDHLKRVAPSRHATAQRLGATPTGHLEKAADDVGHRYDSREAVVEIVSEGIKRALGPLEIKPVNKRWLTIPADAESYGKSDGNNSGVAALRAEGWNIFRPRGRMFLAGTKGRGKAAKDTFKVLFWLKSQVTIPHDPGLLPEPDEIGAAVREGVKTWYLKKYGM